MTQETFTSVAIIVGFAAFLIYVIVKERSTGRLVGALTEVLLDAQNHTHELDLAERLATQVVPASLVQKVDATADWLKQFTPDEIDRLIDAGRGLLDRVTDGKPNLPPPPQDEVIPQSDQRVAKG